MRIRIALKLDHDELKVTSTVVIGLFDYIININDFHSRRASYSPQAPRIVGSRQLLMTLRTYIVVT